MSYLIYLHGFNSSPASEKAQLTRAFFETFVPSTKLHVPALPHEPLLAMESVKALINELGVDNLAGFIGSSLGGYYGLYLQYHYLQQRNNKSRFPKLILINPAIKPYELLNAYLGENQNMHTGEVYQVEPRHMTELKSLEVDLHCAPNKQFLITQTADEVLPFQDAVTKLNGCKMWIDYGGSHAFDAFQRVLPAIATFFQRNHTN